MNLKSAWSGLSRALSIPTKDPRIGVEGWHLAPGFSSCGRCRTPWKFVEHHTTYYEPGSGCFPLCELCWSEMTPQERLPFYYVLFRQWEWDAGRAGHPPSCEWPAMEQAVLNEGELA